MGFTATVGLVCIFVWCCKELKSSWWHSEHICLYVFDLKCYLRPEMPCESCSRRHLNKSCSHLIASHCTVCIWLSQLWSRIVWKKVVFRRKTFLMKKKNLLKVLKKFCTQSTIILKVIVLKTWICLV